MRLLAVLLCCTLAVSCTPSRDGRGRSGEQPFVGPPTQVSWLVYRSGQRISLVNETHTARLALYSEVRDEAGPKVVDDEVMDELVKYFEQNGFGRHALPGHAPDAGSPHASQALELSVNGRVSHMVLGTASDEKERLAFHECSKALVNIWNMTYQGQAVKNRDGMEFFHRQGVKVELGSR